MPEKKNALAKLAEQITDVLAFAQDELYLEHKQTLNKCERIVAELAKVKIVRNKYSNESCWPTTGDVMDAFDKIIAIAEEGAGDGK